MNRAYKSVSETEGADGIAIFPVSYYGSGVQTITCKIPPSLNAKLEAVANKRGLSKSDVVREALETQLPEQQRKAGLSAHDLMKHACGVVDSGHKDLATNPKHMKDFGRV